MSTTEEYNSIGKVIVNVQDELKSLKSVLNNLPGFPEGKVPLQFSKLHGQLDKIENNLQGQKNTIITNIMNEGTNTTQDIP
jgi:hypothetical protein